MPKRLFMLAWLICLLLVAGGCDSETGSRGKASRTAAIRAARETAASRKICRAAEAAKKRVPRECRITKSKRP